MGLTASGGILGGGFPGYGLYRAREGHVALAALERHFWERLRALGIKADDRRDLERPSKPGPPNNGRSGQRNATSLSPR